MENINYIRTDLATECPPVEKNEQTDGITVYKKELLPASITTVQITNENGEKAANKPMGTYVTVSFDKIWFADDRLFNETAEIIAEEIRKLSDSMSGDNTFENIMIVGLGNRYITSDAIGPQSIKGITVTRHIKSRDEELFKALKSKNVSAITPGVIGQTGIETAELIKSASENVRPDLIVVIDALASKSIDRLASTVQISDTGLSPGSGIGNKNKAINKDTLGIPVIAIGVPTMVDSSTLVYDALEKAGIDDLCDELVQILENGKRFFVTLNESDIVISSLARLISTAVNLAFSTEDI